MKLNKVEKIKWIIFVILLILFIALVLLIKTNKTLTIDSITYTFISKNIISKTLTPIVNFITNLGGVIYFIIISVGALILVKNRKISLAISLNIALGALLNKVVKHLIQRERPTEEIRLIEESGFSFPSGHSAVSMIFYGFMIYLVSKYIKNKYLKLFFTILLSALIMLIGLSRVYLGVHYITDVLGGFLIGVMFLIVYISAYQKLTK